MLSRKTVRPHDWYIQPFTNRQVLHNILQAAKLDCSASEFMQRGSHSVTYSSGLDRAARLAARAGLTLCWRSCGHAAGAAWFACHITRPTKLALVVAAIVSVDLRVLKMNLLLRNVHKSPSLIAFSDYRESEAHNDLQTSVSNSGELLEYETLELRVHPPNIDIDNEYDPSCTLITVDSANRPGTLVEVLLNPAQSLIALLLRSVYVSIYLCFARLSNILLN